ncbi:hypothetical protein A0Z09_005805 [Campylobacter subantarcticus]|uniref:Uncharacterized protein n=1 Tax=Campylobacter subantarcticus TaxID=497724 RepID=A0ABW9N5J0_9BACT|nr:hypothetical protein [Campylobacter subantarcticus]EAJ1260701.1 hypothetical protein [Campylobacter lari]MPB99554.1 hypothetical protein [Campylobacter subantarcticus]
MLKFSSTDKKLMQIIDDFNENLDQNSLKQKAKENLEKWQKEENISNEFFSQALFFIKICM